MATRTDNRAPDDGTVAESKSEAGLGRSADSPGEIPAKGWKSVLLRTKEQVKTDNVSVLAAGVAFYLLLALAPALIAALSIYGMVSDRADATRQIQEISSGLPSDVQGLLKEQMEGATERPESELGLTLAFGITAAILSASKGAKSLIETVNVAFDEEETRSFMKVRLLALGFTAGAVVMLLAAVAIMGLLPALGRQAGDAGELIGNIVRWPLLALLMIVALAALYRFAPDRTNSEWAWVTPGATVALVLWLIGSALFSVYANTFANFAETYGTLASVVAMMLWLFLTAFAILVGAEINCEAERQTRNDSTVGGDQPLGSRGAVAADTVGTTPLSRKERKAMEEEDN